MDRDRTEPLDCERSLRLGTHPSQAVSDLAKVGCGDPALGEEPIEQTPARYVQHQRAVDPARLPLFGDLDQGVAGSLALFDQGPDHGRNLMPAHEPCDFPVALVAPLT
jgi:hypothetical protein